MDGAVFNGIVFIVIPNPRVCAEVDDEFSGFGDAEVPNEFVDMDAGFTLF